MSDTEFGELFGTSVRDIKAAYRRLGHTLGWRFLTGPKATLDPATEVALISLNPGGSAIPADHPSASSEAGSSYLIESWNGPPRGQAPLQRQVQALFREIMARRSETGSVADFLATRVLTSHFIPFRSPSFATLTRRSESVEFGRDLWRRILAAWRPRLLVTIDREAYTNLGAILNRQGAVASMSRVFRPVGATTRLRVAASRGCARMAQ
ncbi:MAG: hypothetical protein EXR87_07795 [Gammaproteobacteria bacterium]|nr:hypothetical protein [Gammaproteobacteria bacterium]